MVYGPWVFSSQSAYYYSIKYLRRAFFKLFCLCVCILFICNMLSKIKIIYFRSVYLAILWKNSFQEFGFIYGCTKLIFNFRGMAVSLSMMLGRIGSIFGSNVAGLMINNYCEIMFYSFGGLLLCKYTCILFIQHNSCFFLNCLILHYYDVCQRKKNRFKLLKPYYKVMIVFKQRMSPESLVRTY